VAARVAAAGGGGGSGGSGGAAAAGSGGVRPRDAALGDDDAAREREREREREEPRSPMELLTGVRGSSQAPLVQVGARRARGVCAECGRGCAAASLPQWRASAASLPTHPPTPPR